MCQAGEPTARRASFATVADRPITCLTPTWWLWRPVYEPARDRVVPLRLLASTRVAGFDYAGPRRLAPASLPSEPLPVSTSTNSPTTSNRSASTNRPIASLWASRPRPVRPCWAGRDPHAGAAIYLPALGGAGAHARSPRPTFNRTSERTCRDPHCRHTIRTRTFPT
jgi:hypothetical protein